MSRLTRDGTAKPVSRDQILRHARGQGNINFPCSADHEQDWQPYPVDPYSAICDDHTYIHTYPPEGHQIGARKRRAPGNTILSQPYRRRVSTDRPNPEGRQLAASLEGEPGPTPAGKTLPHSYPDTRFRWERARDVHLH